MKTTFHVHIGTVKFATQFKESPCSPLVTFPSFGSEGHGAQTRRGTPRFLGIFLLDSMNVFSCNLLFFFLLNQVRCEKSFKGRTSNLDDPKFYPSCHFFFPYKPFVIILYQIGKELQKY